MTTSDYISFVALAISFISLAMSVYFGLLDRVRIKATCELINANSDFATPYLEIKVVNRGRRPAVLTSFGGILENNEWINTYIGKDGKGIRLAENENHIMTIERSDLQEYDPVDGSVHEYVGLYFQDSRGRRHFVKHSRREITHLKEASNKPIKPTGKGVG